MSNSSRDLFRHEIDGNGGVRAVPRRQIYTTDGKPVFGRIRTCDGPRAINASARDTLLTPPTAEEEVAWARHTNNMSGFDPGQVWQGDLQPVGKALMGVMDALRGIKDKARQKDALGKAVIAIADFGNGPSDALAFPGNSDDGEDVNGYQMSKASVGDSGSAQLRAWRDQTSNEVARINAMNRRHYAKKG